jgi:hypothetical protein
LTTLDERYARNERIFGAMKALVLNAVGRGFDLDDVDIAAPMGREALVDVRASGLCHTDLTIASRTISLREVNDGYAALKTARSRASSSHRSEHQ